MSSLHIHIINVIKLIGRRGGEINVCTIIGFREVGQGHSGIKNVLRCMNIHPISSSSFTSLNKQVANAYCNAAAESMQNAASDVRSLHPVTPMDMSKPPHPMCWVLVDGLWQKRGHASLHGVVTAISESKCVEHPTVHEYTSNFKFLIHIPQQTSCLQRVNVLGMSKRGLVLIYETK